MHHTNANNQPATTSPRAAWHWFGKCQKVADDRGYGGHWARVSATAHDVDFSRLEAKFPETPVEPLIKHLSEGVYWLRSMVIAAQEQANGYQISYCAEQAIACFGHALNIWMLEQEEDR
jgi:hypothetical protein